MYWVCNCNENHSENTVAIDDTPKKIVIIDATGCNPQK
jgi:hypothetical protein